MKKMRKPAMILTLILALALSACSAGDMSYQEPPASAADTGGSEVAIPLPVNPDRSDEADGMAPEAPGADSYESNAGIRFELSDGEEEPTGNERYLPIDENDAALTARQSTLTFSLKVDTASYSNVARYLESGSLPPADAVRVEELINYFSYDQALRFGGDIPFAIYSEVGPSPFDSGRQLAFVRVKTPELDKRELPSTNFTFLIDTSGSMNSHDKLPLLQQSLALLVETLDGDDVVSIVTYAGSSEILLDSVSGAETERILAAINSLSAGGSTAGANGITTAYALAEKNFMRGGNNRVILASDGDFNVGVSSLDGLNALVGEKRDSGVYLSVLGFGTGNIRDDVMETLAANGNGNYSYINNLATANKVLVEEMAANLFTVADDVKTQVEFNPQNVSSYRLIGYENRRMRNEDFTDDTRDAGEIGVGTDVVMLFEIELADAGGSRYGGTSGLFSGRRADELFEVRIRYKNPGESTSREITDQVTRDRIRAAGQTSSDFGFASSVAAFGHLLRGSEYSGQATLDEVVRLARENLGRDEKGYRLDYLLLLRQYEALAG